MPTHSCAQIDISPALTREARSYALRQLAIRAGVQAEFTRTWQVKQSPHETVLDIAANGGGRIRFKHAPADHWARLSAQQAPVARLAGWEFDRNSTTAADYIVPFIDAPPGQPLFRRTSANEVECTADLLASVLLTLGRFEELTATKRDQHCRFAARQSLACKHGFLHRPIVDEYGLALEQILKALVPQWQPRPRTLRVKLTHDIDHVGIPFRWRSVAGHVVRRRTPSSALRDLLSALTGTEPELLRCVRRLAQLTRKYNLASAVYWKASAPGPWDSGYDPRHARIAHEIAALAAEEVENGVHPGYETYLAPERLHAEVAVLSKLFQTDNIGGRQHYLRWCPETWLHWEQCGLAYDTSVGFADQIGYRCGTCHPYRPWLLWLNREARLLEVPLLVMDGTLKQLRVSPGRMHELMSGLVASCAAVGGVFTVLWHNQSLLEPEYGSAFERLLQSLNSCPSFDHRNAPDAPCPTA